MLLEQKKIEERKGLYIFNKFPDNVRQVGEQSDEGRIYIEDYVVTYMRQIYAARREDALVVFVGNVGQQETEGTTFLYGAMEVEVELLHWKEQFSEEKWKEIHRKIAEFFPGGQIMGWGCGVQMATSQIKKVLAEIHRKYFSRDGQVLFCYNLGEDEETVCRTEQGSVHPVSGYMIYYGKNPQMQEFMLQGKQKKSFEAGYQDEVMASVRTVIREKSEQHKHRKKAAFYLAGVMLFLLSAIGIRLMLQSNQKIESLEETIETLSGLPGKGQKEVEIETEKPEPTEKETATVAQETKNASKTTPPPFPTFDESNEKSGQKNQVTKKPVAKVTATPATKKTEKKEKEEKNETTAGKTEKKSVVRISAPAQQTASYVVKKGDTLSQIVWRQYHTTAYLNSVKKVNGIRNEDQIKAGQRIILPAYGK